TGKFHVGNFTADIGPDQGAWGPFAHNYRLDFSAATKPGQYQVVVEHAGGRIESPRFAIGPDAYAAVPGKLLEFMQLQRCGDNPVTGQKCHQGDAFDADTGEQFDMTGG